MDPLKPADNEKETAQQRANTAYAKKINANLTQPIMVVINLILTMSKMENDVITGINMMKKAGEPWSLFNMPVIGPIRTIWEANVQGLLDALFSKLAVLTLMLQKLPSLTEAFLQSFDDQKKVITWRRGAQAYQVLFAHMYSINTIMAQNLKRQQDTLKDVNKFKIKPSSVPGSVPGSILRKKLDAYLVIRNEYQEFLEISIDWFITKLEFTIPMTHTTLMDGYDKLLLDLSEKGSLEELEWAAAVVEKAVKKAHDDTELFTGKKRHKGAWMLSLKILERHKVQQKIIVSGIATRSRLISTMTLAEKKERMIKVRPIIPVVVSEKKEEMESSGIRRITVPTLILPVASTEEEKLAQKNFIRLWRFSRIMYLRLPVGLRTERWADHSFVMMKSIVVDALGTIKLMLEGHDRPVQDQSVTIRPIRRVFDTMASVLRRFPAESVKAETLVNLMQWSSTLKRSYFRKNIFIAISLWLGNLSDFHRPSFLYPASTSMWWRYEDVALDVLVYFRILGQLLINEEEDPWAVVKEMHNKLSLWLRQNPKVHK